MPLVLQRLERRLQGKEDAGFTNKRAKKKVKKEDKFYESELSEFSQIKEAPKSKAVKKEDIMSAKKNE